MTAISLIKLTIICSLFFELIFSLSIKNILTSNKVIKKSQIIKSFRTNALFMSDNEVSKFKYDNSKIRNFSIIAHIGILKYLFSIILKLHYK